jgi:hypothetical protein
MARNSIVAFVVVAGTLMGASWSGAADPVVNKKPALRRESVQARIEVELHELDLKIDALAARAEKETSAAKATLQAKSKKLERRKADTHKQFEALKSAAADSWQALEEGTEDAMKDLRKSLRKIETDFKKS